MIDEAYAFEKIMKRKQDISLKESKETSIKNVNIVAVNLTFQSRRTMAENTIIAVIVGDALQTQRD